MRQEVKQLIDMIDTNYISWDPKFESIYEPFGGIRTAKNIFSLDSKTTYFEVEVNNGWLFKSGRINMNQVSSKKTRTIELERDEVVYADKVIRKGIDRLKTQFLKEAKEWIKGVSE